VKTWLFGLSRKKNYENWQRHGTWPSTPFQDHALTVAGNVYHLSHGS